MLWFYGFFLFVLVFFLWSTVLRFQLKAVIGQCSQDEFKVWHPAPALLLVWVHTVLRVFFGKWAEGAASLLICEATVKYLLLFWMQQAMQGCGAVGNVLSTTLHFNQHLSCNSETGLNWTLFLHMGNQNKCFIDENMMKQFEFLYLYFHHWHDWFILSALPYAGYIVVNGGYGCTDGHFVMFLFISVTYF